MSPIQKLSKVFGLKIAEGPVGNYRSNSQKLFADLGLVRVNNGLGTLFPIMIRSLRKLESLVRREMEEVSAVEILLPSLTNCKLLEKSGRSDLPDIFKLEQKETNYFLNPTCEEAITDLMASANGLNHSHLPCRFYQISNKFRDEKRSKSGLIRTKEFIMKDLYCFDSSAKQSEITYEEIKKKYHDIFRLLNVPYICIRGAEDTIGGLHSDEFHFLSDVGDDNIILCQECSHNQNLNCVEHFEQCCPNCQSKNIKVCKGIEVGHTFLLGTKYTKPFDATYFNKDGERDMLHMSCFGLGLTRILSASVDVLTLNNEIKWPLQIAPYLVCIIPPKAGSKEEIAAENLIQPVLYDLYKFLREDIIVDDRTHLSIGKRFNTVKTLGLPFAIIFGKDICGATPSAEVHDIDKGLKTIVQISDITQFVQDMLSSKSLVGNFVERKNVIG